MSLRHAILGILDYRPLHGYELKRVLENGISSFWPVNLGAIYPNLHALETEGLVAHHTESTAEGRPDRKVYTITESGREELARWRRLPPEGHTRTRSPLYLKLLFARRENLRDGLEWIDAEIQHAQAAAAYLKAQLADPQAFSTFFVQFLRESGVAHLNLHAELLQELRERIDRDLLRKKRPKSEADAAAEAEPTPAEEPEMPAG